MGGPSFTGGEALSLRADGRPGRIEVTVFKPMGTERHLSLACSRGVARPGGLLTLAAFAPGGMTRS